MYTLDEEACIWISSVEDVSNRKKHSVLELFDSPHDAFMNFSKKEQDIIAIIGEIGYKAFVKSRETYRALIEKLEDLDIIAVTYYSDTYPELLKEIVPPPLVIYCKGNLSLLKSNNIGVVGTRDCSRYGREVTEKFVSDLVGNGFTIVSGLAFGIDEIAHQTALNLNGNTIAVVASGLDIIYPKEHTNLFNKIVDNGLVVSEYIPGTPPNGFQFPERNRIISGLSSGVLVTEAGEKSGALITLDYAVEQDRSVYIVPGSITSKFSRGCNLRIKQMQGAMVTQVEDILSDLGMIGDYEEKRDVTAIQLDFTEQKLLIELEKGEMHFDELLQFTGLNVGELNSLLTKMEICGLVKKNSGNYYEL